MTNTPIIKSYPFLKHYKRESDDKSQVVIRARIYFLMAGKQILHKTFDVKLLSPEGNIVRATDAELKNRNIQDNLKYRIPEVDLMINKGILRLIRENKELNLENVFKFTYKVNAETDNQANNLIFNNDIEELFGYPIPIAVWEEIISQKFISEETGEAVLYEELEDIARNIESEYYSHVRKEEVEKMSVNERYKKGEFDKNNIFECFGFCWSNHPTKDEPLICGGYKGLLLRLHDYRYNECPSEINKDFNEDWINDFLKFLVQEGYALVHPKNYTPFNLIKHKIDFIKAERHAYKFGAFEKLVKQLKRYIFLLQKNNIIAYNRNIDNINAKDFISRTVNTTGYTRRTHSLTIEEFKKLSSTDFGNPKLNTARDMFVIATLGGGFRGEEFYNDELSIEERDDNYVINIYRSKTQTLESNPVFGALEKLIIKNNGNLPKFLPIAEFRKSLKKIAEILEFNRIIISPDTSINSSGKQVKHVLKDIFSIYFARKTFVEFLDSAGMVDDDIIEFTSHSKTDTLKHYKGNLSLNNKFKVLKKLNLDI